MEASSRRSGNPGRSGGDHDHVSGGGGFGGGGEAEWTSGSSLLSYTASYSESSAEYSDGMVSCGLSVDVGGDVEAGKADGGEIGTTVEGTTVSSFGERATSGGWEATFHSLVTPLSRIKSFANVPLASVRPDDGAGAMFSERVQSVGVGGGGGGGGGGDGGGPATPAPLPEALQLLAVARESRAVLARSPLAYFAAVRTGARRLEQIGTPAFALAEAAACPVTGVVGKTYELDEHAVAIGSAFVFRPPPSIKKWIHAFAVASADGDAFAALCGFPPSDALVAMLRRLLAPDITRPIPLLAFLAYASAFSKAAVQELRLGAIFALAARPGAGGRGATVSLGSIVAVPHVVLEAPNATTLRGTALAEALLTIWPSGDAELEWEAFLAAMAGGELVHESKLTLAIPATAHTSRWASRWLTRARVFSTVTFSADTSLLAGCLAVAEDLHLPPHVGVERAQAWTSALERHELYTVGDVNGLTQGQWDAAVSHDLPAGLLSRLAPYGIKPSPPPPPSKARWWAARLRLHLAIDRPFAFWLVLLVVLLVEETTWSISTAQSYAAHAVLGRSLESAKAFAAFIRVITAFMFIPVTDTLYMVVSRLVPLPPIRLRPTKEHLMLFHKIGGVAILVAGIGHTVSHVINATKIVNASDSATAAAFGPGTPLAPLGAQDTVAGILFRTWLGVSGLILLACMLVIVALAHPAVRKAYFELFMYPHYLFVPYVCVLAAHPTTVRTALFALPGFVLYVISRAISAAHALPPATLVELELMPQSVVKLAFAKSAWMAKLIALGDYVYVNVPAFSQLQWHPFSVASSPSMDSVHLYIEAVGPPTAWTRQLAAAAKAGTQPALRISGPFPADPLPYLAYERTVLVASGIGVTPFAAVLMDIVYRLRTGADLPVKHLHVWWVAKSIAHFQWALDLLAVLESLFYSSPRELELTLDIRLFATRDTFVDLPFTVVRGRPHFPRLLHQMETEIMAPHEPPAGVFLSGNEYIAVDVHSAVASSARFEYNHEMLFTG